MRPFTYARATSAAEAADLSAADGAKLIGGGTNLLDLMKLEIEHPSKLVDVSRIEATPIEEKDGACASPRLRAASISAPTTACARNIRC
jgi:xanthine dehydrogenase YagS FAD-binding subunit